MISAASDTPAAQSASRLERSRSEDSLVRDFRSEAEAHAAREAPREACGVLVAGRYIACRNIAGNPEQDFVLNPVDYARAALTGKIEAIVHSHPQGGPASEADLAACRHTRVPWHIYLIPSDEWLTIGP